MNRIRYAAAALLLVALCPGLGELVENAGYLLAHGHLAHVSAADHGDTPAGPEHGCTGTFHICPCHTTPTTLLPAETLLIQMQRSGQAFAATGCRTHSGPSGGVYRPPRIA